MDTKRMQIQTKGNQTQGYILSAIKECRGTFCVVQGQREVLRQLAM